MGVTSPILGQPRRTSAVPAWLSHWDQEGNKVNSAVNGNFQASVTGCLKKIPEVLVVDLMVILDFRRLYKRAEAARATVG